MARPTATSVERGDLAEFPVVTVPSIDEVRAEAWDALAGPDDFYQSRDWLAVVEQDNTASPQYLLASSAGRLVGALPVYEVKHEITQAYQPEKLRSLLGAPGDHLLAGTRRCYRSEIMVARSLQETVRQRITAMLVRGALAAAAERGMSGIGFRYLPTPALMRLGRVAPVVACFDDGEAVIDGVGRGLDAYLHRQSSKLRSKIRREIRKFAATAWRVDVRPLADCLDDVARLVSNVEERHGHTTPDFLLRRLFRRQIEEAQHREVVFTCHDERDEMVACAVNYAWRDTLYSRVVGLDYGRLGGSFAYFNLLVYRAIEYAGAHGLDRLHLGLASPSKAERGAMVRPLWAAAVRVDAGHGPPGVRLVRPDSLRRWSEPYRRYAHALPAHDWSIFNRHRIGAAAGRGA
jgi:predicted N-acyltransferase